MIHLYALLLLVQYSYLFINSLFSFFTIYWFFHCFIFIIYYILSSLPRFSAVNVVLIINDSLIFFAPSTPILFPDHYFHSFHFLQFIYFFIIISYLLSIYILSSQYRFSSVNVVLIINDSLIFFAPSAPILLTVHYFIIFIFTIYLFFSLLFHIYYLFIYLIITVQIQLSQCSINH